MENRFDYCRNCMLGSHYKCFAKYDRKFICKCKKCKIEIVRAWLVKKRDAWTILDGLTGLSVGNTNYVKIIIGIRKDTIQKKVGLEMKLCDICMSTTQYECSNCGVSLCEKHQKKKNHNYNKGCVIIKWNLNSDHSTF